MLRSWSQEAGIPRKLAPTIGIPVDPRRQNLSTESLTANVERLKAYKARLILFPRKSGQHKKLDSSKEDLQAAKDATRKVGAVLPIDTGVGVKHGVSEVKRSEMPESTEGGAYRKLRDMRSEARLVGVREKRAKQKAEEAEAKKGK
jgi:large subunit ribosomal protein L13e